MASTTDPLDKFNKKNIKFGSNFRSGEAGSKLRRYGLHGALQEYTDPEHLAGKNLSKQDVEKFEKVLGEKLKSKYKYSSGLNRIDRMELIHKLEEMRLKGEISKNDINDFSNIINKLSA